MSESLRAQTSGGADARRPLDFYPTPESATVALLPYISHFPEPIWEPAAGTGSIVKVLRKARRSVVATDIERRGFPLAGCFDFLTTTVSRGKSIVTNPPFNLAEEFIETALAHTPFVALLFKATFWHAARRADLFRSHPPARVLALTWRLDFTGQGAPHRDVIWCLWGPRTPVEGDTLTRYDILTKPPERAKRTP